MKHYRLHDNINTDAAWTKVYARLQEEGLIEEPSHRKHARRILIPALLTACIAIAIAVIIPLFNKEKEDLTGNLHGTILWNGNDATLVHSLEDGSIVYLGENSRFEYPERFIANVRRTGLTGRAMFNISANPQRPFLIETERMLVEVTGTSFDIETGNDNNSIAVQSGQVKITLKQNNQSAYLSAGQTARLSAGRIHVEQTADSERFTRYTERIGFKDETLGNILSIINRRGGDLILRADPLLENRRITVAFAGSETAQDIARIISAAFGLSLKQDDRQILISPAQ